MILRTAVLLRFFVVCGTFGALLKINDASKSVSVHFSGNPTQGPSTTLAALRSGRDDRVFLFLTSDSVN